VTDDIGWCAIAGSGDPSVRPPHREPLLQIRVDVHGTSSRDVAMYWSVADADATASLEGRQALASAALQALQEAVPLLMAMPDD